MQQGLHRETRIKDMDMNEAFPIRKRSFFFWRGFNKRDGHSHTMNGSHPSSQKMPQHMCPRHLNLCPCSKSKSGPIYSATYHVANCDMELCNNVDEWDNVDASKLHHGPQGCSSTPHSFEYNSLNKHNIIPYCQLRQFDTPRVSTSRLPLYLVT
ncbi:hypothetical protein GOP47_0023849 [Adiantum capillus-veneris]|uniref:Uncharacterized protein n=1 Tax=Adiantum capillus-veneris TaxID=13818 RepID=A0A9D4Z4U9_ADICA|nr:hypothetical protein GOP47_0023849 [Adiantum capillus-veneris]